MYCKIKQIVVFLPIISNFIILKTLGKIVLVKKECMMALKGKHEIELVRTFVA